MRERSEDRILEEYEEPRIPTDRDKSTPANDDREEIHIVFEPEHKFSYIIRWLKDHWFLLAFFGSTAVWAADTYHELRTLKDVVIENQQMKKDVQLLKENSARIDERSVQMMKSQERQEKMIEMLLESQQKDQRYKRTKE